jgi:hypothetical protein
MLSEWAAAWRIPDAAISDLQARLSAATLPPDPISPPPPRSEAAVQAAVRVAASRAGLRVWRNNKGALQAPHGGWVRFGLANDTAAMGDHVRSADLIGIRPRIVTPDLVGSLIGQFVSFEVKAAGWRWRGDDHEVAQKRWADLVTALGGEARFVSDESHV